MTKTVTIGLATLYCGDCREILPSLKGDAVITDPPYGVGKRYGDAYDDSPEGYWEWFLPALALMRQAAPVLAFTHRLNVLQHVTDWDWVAAWHKPMSFGARIGNSPVLPHWEPILLFGIHALGTKRECFHDVLSVNPEQGSAAGKRAKGGGKKIMGRETNGFEPVAGHPLPKPVLLFKKLVAGLTLPGQTVIDPFLGSGTTGAAAVSLERNFIGIEIEPRFFDEACEKVENAQRQERLFA